MKDLTGGFISIEMYGEIILHPLLSSFPSLVKQDRVSISLIKIGGTLHQIEVLALKPSR